MSEQVTTGANKDFPDLIVSVESRKGGVGKTTAALSLGRILLRKGYAVLMLDLDVTGTNAADIADSPFWSSDLHVVSHTVDVKNRSPEHTNLFVLFDEYFMIGTKIPTFFGSSSDSDKISLDTHKVNVLGSQIYRTDPYPKNEDKSPKKLTYLERPSVLFDDLHSLWFLNFIKQLVSDFCRAVKSQNQMKVAIILDNSPGYVGFAPEIHEWLTDCGPSIGKFINVASLDGQDLLACDRGIGVLHALFKTKWDTSRLFIDAQKKGKTISVKKDQEAFFMRLATCNGSSDVINESLACYTEKDQKKQKTTSASLKEPWRYIGLLINKVPRSVKRRDFLYGRPIVNTSNLDLIIGKSSSSNNVNAWRECMVTFDEYVENQFLWTFLKGNRSKSRTQLHVLLKKVENTVNRLNSDIQKYFHVSSSRSNYRGLPDLKSQLTCYNEYVTQVRSDLDTYGYDHLARLIRDEWMPNSIILSFQTALSRLLRESELMHFGQPSELSTEQITAVQQEKMAFLRKYIATHLNKSLQHSTKGNTLDMLVESLIGLAGISLSSTVWPPMIHNGLPILLTGIIEIELRRWGKSRKNEASSHDGLQRFLAQETINASELEKIFISSGEHISFRSMFLRKDVTVISEFYKVCATAQARVIDLAADSQFLLQLIQHMLHEENNNKNLFPFVRGLAEDVIERKIISHEEAPDKMANALRSNEYFKDFDQVLERILRKWEVGVCNG